MCVMALNFQVNFYMNSSSPFYLRFALILLTIWLLLYGLYMGQKILLPFGFAFLIAVLLQPVEKFFVDRKIPRVVAILLSLLIAVIVLFSLLTFIYQQVGSFVNDVPAIEKNLTHLF